MICEVSLDLVDNSELNSRLEYSEEDIKKLASSISKFGLLSPIRLRKKSDRYEIVYGHKRVQAMRLLGRTTISADVCDIADKEAYEQSFVENVARGDLSDYEKAVYFESLNQKFNMTYEEIGDLFGFGKSHVCNYVHMAQLFDQKLLAKNRSLRSKLFSISERHARVLLEIPDVNKRLELLDIVVSENLSVRELERIVRRLRGWYLAEEENFGNEQVFDAQRNMDRVTSQSDLLEVENALKGEFGIACEPSFRSCSEFHAHGPDWSVFSILGPSRLLVGAQSERIHAKWFSTIAPKISPQIKDLRVQFLDSVAISTCFIRIKSTSNDLKSGEYGGTIILIRKGDRWKIIHQHWSRIDLLEKKFTRENSFARKKISRFE